MTDEEMAVNWIRSQGWSEETLPSDEFRQMFQAFLAGLKTGKDTNVSTKWHKVADGDLPEESRTVLDEAGDRFYYFRGHFYYDSDSRFDCSPIAWCEIPKYTEA